MEQNKQDNQQPQASQDILLSDADYEFLFNQLLEGVTHGWHDRKIVKFFERLGERGKQENWVAWLERLRSKIITLPIESKRQLGTIMVRLGELAQSAPQVSQIGAASNRIGRELLFGNTGITEDVIWEYVGPDLIVDSPDVELETAEEISERLPTDFTELSSAAEVEDQEAIKETAEDAEKDIVTEESFVIASPWDDEDNANNNANSSETTPQKELTETADVSESAEIAMVSEAPVSESPNLTSEESSPAVNTDNDEFEFELETFELDELEPLEQQKNSVELTPEPDNSAVKESSKEELQELLPVEELEELSLEPLPVEELPVEELSKPDPVAIDLDRVMNLIQEDEELAQEISQKLNVSLVEEDNSLDNALQVSSPEPPSIEPINLDRSSIDLIEGWFNLGLKQVSGGEFDKAIASWEKALKINPNLSEAWHNRGSALGRLGKYQEAVASFEKALTIDPHNYQAWNDRAHALYQLQNWAAAADSWSNAIKITPGNHLFWYNRGCALEQLESWAESISSYEKSLEIKPDFQPARSRYTNLVADNSRSN